ncbi:hypothetical protein CS542_03835 [Pedobacter sp. IW39]|nr:hypothetical protein CS542_03835 [Pedobacter sp. IW39]
MFLFSMAKLRLLILKAVVKQQYGSGLTIGAAGTLDLNAQYVTVRINTIRGMRSSSSIRFRNQYYQC